MAKFVLNARRTEYSQAIIYADSLEEAESAAEEYDEYDFNWYGGSIEIEVEEVDEA